jgi:hypothetical protein
MMISHYFTAAPCPTRRASRPFFIFQSVKMREIFALSLISSQHAYEVRPRKDKRGVALISDALLFCSG